MIDITLETFESDLLATSAQVPVLLDIWAPWCGPCKQLGPVLEKLEIDYGGRFMLAKVNADEEQEIATQLSQMFGVRSIPFCVMFTQGQPVDGFVGALPEAQIREFLDKYVPPAGDDDGPLDEALAEDDASALPPADSSDPSGTNTATITASSDALARLQAALAQDPSQDETRFELIKLLLAQGALPEALAAFEPVRPRAQGPVPEARVLAFALYLEAAQAASQAPSPADLEAAIATNKRDFEARFALAQRHFAAGRFTDAMDALLEIIMRDKAWADERARKTFVAILEVMSRPVPKPKAAPARSGASGPGAPGGPAEAPKLALSGHAQVVSSDPVIDQYRRKLSMALF